MTNYWMLANQTLNTNTNWKNNFIHLYILNKNEREGLLYIFCPGLDWVKGGKPAHITSWMFTKRKSLLSIFQLQLICDKKSNTQFNNSENDVL